MMQLPLPVFFLSQLLVDWYDTEMAFVNMIVQASCKWAYHGNY